MTAREFHGKILLFGEYSILLDAMALVVPLKAFSGRLEFPHGGNEINAGARKSSHHLLGYLKHLLALDRSGQLGCEMHLERLQSDIANGIYFHSLIPESYGAGSSGALVAAVYDKYKKDNAPRGRNDLHVLRNFFGRMESFFHGRSSGIDPLCCYTDRALLAGGKTVRPAEIPDLPVNSSFFLLDSGRKGDTGALVGRFFGKMKDPSFRSVIEDDYFPLNEDCITSAIRGNHRELQGAVKQLSKLEAEHFTDMIPGNIREFWHYGIQSGMFSLKLCGSGGGGFMLGFTQDLAATESWFLERGTRIRIIP